MLIDPSDLQGDLWIAPKGGTIDDSGYRVRGMRLLQILSKQGGIVNAWLGVIGIDSTVRWVASLQSDSLPEQFTTDAIKTVIGLGRAFNFIDHANLMSGGLFPLVERGEVLGVMGITSDQTDYFKPDTVRWITVLCGIISDDIFVNQESSSRDIEHSISRILQSSLDVRDGMPNVLKTLAEVLEADAIITLQFDPRAHRFKLLMTHGLDSGALAKLNFHHDLGMAGRSLDGRMAWIEDLHSPARTVNQISPLREEGFRSYLALPLIRNGNLIGALEIAWRSPQYSDTWDVGFLERIAEQIAFVMERTNVLNDYREINTELTVRYNAMIEGLSRALELRDLETEGHTRRVSRLTMRLVEYMGIAADQWDAIRQGALLHDIGKIGIPDAILLKPGSLTPRERQVMEQHVVYGYNILAPITSLRPVLDITLYHHEHWDGSGYPYGLKGENIPLVARIFAFVDVFDALTSDRPYRMAWSRTQALEYIQEQSGRWFDPHIVVRFIQVANEGI